MKYKSVRMPLEAYESALNKKKEMEKDLFDKFGIKGNIPLTNIFVAAFDKQIFNIDELPKLAKRRWKT